ncbi:pectin lyase fold/virulence factor [Coniochaeta sp. 2T2.1]|nr:pectin lyase fold/virulence factor [Coniochaeta sp. 2T2.1]
MKSLLLLLSLASLCLATKSRTTPPPGCLSVGTTPGAYSTIQSAVDSLSLTSPAPQCIFIHPGLYIEQVLLPARAAQLSIYGSTPDVSSYARNTVTISGSKSQKLNISNDETATLRVKSASFKLYNVNVENTFGKGSQAVAVSAYADSGYYGCALRGFQDTLLAQVGKQVYARTMIEGATDFIFGQHAPAWFEGCDVRVVAPQNGIGYVTASGRSSSTDPNYYVFNNCDVSAADGNAVADGAYFLGRPWSMFAKVVFQRSSLSKAINPAGWHIWNVGDERTSNVTFAEFGNTGAGAAGPRANFSTALARPVKIGSVLGCGYARAGYFDAEYM